jgi:hypothetical protein
METKQLQLVTREQARRLKKLRFDWETDYHYYERCDKTDKLEGPGLVRQNWNSGTYFYSIPTVCLALKWIRDCRHIPNAVKLYVEIRVMSNKPVYEYSYFFKGLEYHDFNLHFKTYEAAESALLDELLTILEKEKEQ